MEPCALGDKVAVQVKILHSLPDRNVARREQPQRLLRAGREASGEAHTRTYWPPGRHCSRAGAAELLPAPDQTLQQGQTQASFHFQELQRPPHDIQQLSCNHNGFFNF